MYHPLILYIVPDPDSQNGVDSPDGLEEALYGLVTFSNERNPSFHYFKNHIHDTFMDDFFEWPETIVWLENGSKMDDADKPIPHVEIEGKRYAVFMRCCNG